MFILQNNKTAKIREDLFIDLFKVTSAKTTFYIRLFSFVALLFFSQELCRSMSSLISRTAEHPSSFLFVRQRFSFFLRENLVFRVRFSSIIFAHSDFNVRVMASAIFFSRYVVFANFFRISRHVCHLCVCKCLSCGFPVLFPIN